MLGSSMFVIFLFFCLSGLATIIFNLFITASYISIYCLMFVSSWLSVIFFLMYVGAVLVLVYYIFSLSSNALNVYKPTSGLFFLLLFFSVNLWVEETLVVEKTSDWVLAKFDGFFFFFSIILLISLWVSSKLQIFKFLALRVFF